MFKPKITKEEINLLPVARFEGKITVVDNALAVAAAVAELRKHKIVGIDTETKPCFEKGKSHKMSLMQISTLDHCFLFRLHFTDFTDELIAFLTDKNIRKVGLALGNDIIGLKKFHKFKPANMLDLQNIMKNYGILELGLQKIYAILFGERISKSQQLSNWESAKLTEQQQRYAATDAWACLKIYLRILDEKPLSLKELEKLANEN